MPICRLVLPFYAAALLFTAGCNGEGKKTDAPTLAPTASALAASKSESKAATRWKVDEAGTASFTMKGHVETVIKGDTKKMRGQLEIDLADLTKTRGTIECDMTTLAMHTFDDEDKNEKQTVDAQTWLEVHDRIGDPAKVKANQWAVYAIRTITSAEPKDLSKGGATRTAKVTAKGELLLHGRKSEHSVDLEATFELDGDKPKSLKLRTASPLMVSLASHEVEPRDTAGKFLGWAGNAVLRDKVAEDSSVALDLVAKPVP